MTVPLPEGAVGRGFDGKGNVLVPNDTGNDGTSADPRTIEMRALFIALYGIERRVRMLLWMAGVLLALTLGLFWRVFSL
jgi:hypothetical protein